MFLRHSNSFMPDCSKKRNLSHKEWVVYQFYCCDFDSSYKNVFLHTSFIEGLVIDKSIDQHPFPTVEEKEKVKENPNYKRGFRNALTLLESDISGESKLLHKLYDDRNALIHNIARKPNPLDQNGIEMMRNKMWQNILDIYKTSDFIDRLFRERGYEFSPKERCSSITTY